MATYELPWPPSVNNYWHQRVLVSRKTKRPMAVTYISDDGKRFKDNVVAAVRAETPNIAAMQGEVSVYIDLFPPDKRKRDIDNVIKPLFDALTAAQVWVDDSQVYRMQVIKRDGTQKRKGGCVLITIAGLSE